LGNDIPRCSVSVHGIYARFFAYFSKKALASDEVRARIIAEGGEPEPTTPEQHAAVIDQEELKWSTAIRAAGIEVR
jgi:tripartite-type tricarboxylate transporter receptor subunit TctC